MMPEIEFEKSILGQTEIKQFAQKSNSKSAFDILDEVNWDFKNTKTQYLTHRFHSYPARFIPQIPRTFIRLFTKKGDVVLDPFAGCGTTVVESQLLNRNSIGNDLNPLATLISKVKTTPISTKKLETIIGLLDKIEKEIKSNNRKLKFPKLPNRNISNLFNDKMLEEIQIIKENIDNKDIKLVNLTEEFISKAKKIQAIYGIDIGEAETIALALQLNKEEAIIDEISAREAAKAFGLRPIGTLRVLLIAYKHSLINKSEIKKLINEMENSKYRFSPKVLIEFWDLFEKIKKE